MHFDHESLHTLACICSIMSPQRIPDGESCSPLTLSPVILLGLSAHRVRTVIAL
jgi:hypothetical protein